VIRVALAEDHVLLREGISRLVAANEDFEVVGAASDLPRLLALVAEQVPDVVVTDALDQVARRVAAGPPRVTGAAEGEILDL
jgi:DNA-binding NarL/FixJ family response regulator